jgi:hypothetical protein
MALEKSVTSTPRKNLAPSHTATALMIMVKRKSILRQFYDWL